MDTGRNRIFPIKMVVRPCSFERADTRHFLQNCKLWLFRGITYSCWGEGDWGASPAATACKYRIDMSRGNGAHNCLRKPSRANVRHDIGPSSSKARTGTTGTNACCYRQIRPEQTAKRADVGIITVQTYIPVIYARHAVLLDIVI